MLEKIKKNGNGNAKKQRPEKGKIQLIALSLAAWQSGSHLNFLKYGNVFEFSFYSRFRLGIALKDTSPLAGRRNSQVALALSI